MVANGDNPPTAQAGEVREMLVAEIDSQLAELRKVLAEGVAELNGAIREAGIPAIFVEK